MTTRDANSTRNPGRVTARCRRWLAVVGPLLCALAVGCGFSDDPSFNPYTSRDVDPGLWDYADDVNLFLDEALDNLDRRMENVLY